MSDNEKDQPIMDSDEGWRFPAKDDTTVEGHGIGPGGESVQNPDADPDDIFGPGRASEEGDTETEGHGFKRPSTDDPSMDPDGAIRRGATEDPESDDTQGHDRV